MQHKGVQTTRPLPTNAVAGSLNQTRQEAGAPSDEELRISYGVIFDVKDDSNQVRVDIFDKGGKKHRLGIGQNGSKDGIWVPVIQPLPLIHHLFGALRKGLCVRIFWRGKKAPAGDSIIEVVSDLEVTSFLSGSQQPRSNELATGPHDIFTGGVGV